MITAPQIVHTRWRATKRSTVKRGFDSGMNSRRSASRAHNKPIRVEPRPEPGDARDDLGDDRDPDDGGGGNDLLARAEQRADEQRAQQSEHPHAEDLPGAVHRAPEERQEEGAPVEALQRRQGAHPRRSSAAPVRLARLARGPTRRTQGRGRAGRRPARRPRSTLRTPCTSRPAACTLLSGRLSVPPEPKRAPQQR